MTNLTLSAAGADRPPAAPGQARRIQTLNDLLRTQGIGGRWMLTRGVSSLPERDVAAIMAAIRGFTDFSADNDPHGEHDCAVLEIDGHRVIWKIDYYDTALLYHSPDPADPNVTSRVLTVMLAEEY